MFASPSFFDSISTPCNDCFGEISAVVASVVPFKIFSQFFYDISAKLLGDIYGFSVILDGHKGVDANCSGSGEHHAEEFHLFEVLNLIDEISWRAFLRGQIKKICIVVKITLNTKIIIEGFQTIPDRLVNANFMILMVS